MKKTYTLIGLSLLTASASATVITSPSVISGSNAHSTPYEQSNAVDNNANTEYASSNAGTDTFLEFQWGAAQTFDRVILLGRASGANFDQFSEFTLNYGTGDNTFNNPNYGIKRGSIHNTGTVTTQNVRFDVTKFADGTTGAGNTGITEAIFLANPTGTYADAFLISGVTAYSSATAFNDDYLANNAVDGIIGDGGGDSYASAGQGANTFIDFDMGAVTKIIGFDMIDRYADVDHSLTFSLIFSNNADFSSTITTLNFSKNAGDLAYGDDFNYIEARYVRWDVTDGTASANKGLAEMMFYGTAVPEPSAALLGGLGVLALLRRRRA